MENVSHPVNAVHFYPEVKNEKLVCEKLSKRANHSYRIKKIVVGSIALVASIICVKIAWDDWKNKANLAWKNRDIFPSEPDAKFEKMRWTDSNGHRFMYEGNVKNYKPEGKGFVDIILRDSPTDVREYRGEFSQGVCQGEGVLSGTYKDSQNNTRYFEFKSQFDGGKSVGVGSASFDHSITTCAATLANITDLPICNLSENTLSSVVRQLADIPSGPTVTEFIRRLNWGWNETFALAGVALMMAYFFKSSIPAESSTGNSSDIPTDLSSKDKLSLLLRSVDLATRSYCCSSKKSCCLTSKSRSSSTPTDSHI